MTGVMRTSSRAKRSLAAIGMLGVLTASGACGSDEHNSADQDAAGVDDMPAESASGDETHSAAGADVIRDFADSFDDDSNGWAFPPSDLGTADMQDGDFVWDNAKPGIKPHLLPETLGVAYDESRLDMVDVTVTANVTPMRGEGVIGVFCREVANDAGEWLWYEFVVRDGYAAIRQANDAGRLEVLAEGGEDVDLPLGEQAAIEATCVDGEDGAAQLALVFNGEEVLQAEDTSPLGNGAPGLQGYDATDSQSDETMMVRWHDFSVEPAG